MNTLCKTVILLSALALASVSADGATPKPVYVDFCKVFREPKKFSGKLIEVHAQYDSDGFEHEGLKNLSCSHMGIGVLLNGDVEGKAELLDALRQGHPGTLDKVVTGQFVGTFTWDINRHPHGLLNVVQIKRLVVAPVER